MTLTLLRLKAMAAQRFDLSKRRNPSNFVSTEVPSVHLEESSVPQITILSSEPSPSDEALTTNESNPTTNDFTSSCPVVVEATILTHKNDTESNDIFERGGYTTTRTIIRPGSRRSSFLSFFSRPSSPVPGATSRPNSPLDTRIANLNCWGSTDAFEEELDFILQQRENDLAGVTREIEVKVTQDRTVFYEEDYEMDSTLLRFEAMDAQRFDLSKRHNLSAISAAASGVHCEGSGIPEITVLSPELSPSDETWTGNPTNPATKNSASSAPTVVEATIFTYKNDTESNDVFERDGYTTTRTIIRPSSRRSSFLSFFSRPSSPVPGATSRSNSPLGTRVNNLNCMGSTDAFEEELDFILQQRENDLAGVTQEIEVKVIQDQAVFYEEKWRDAIRAILYEPTPPAISCVGHVHGY